MLCEPLYTFFSFLFLLSHKISSKNGQLLRRYTLKLVHVGRVIQASYTIYLTKQASYALFVSLAAQPLAVKTVGLVTRVY